MSMRARSGETLIVVPDAESEADAQAFRDLFAALDAPGVALSVHVGAPESDAGWERVLREADAVVLNWKLPDAALRAAPRLRAVCFLGTGASDHLNLELAAERGVEVATVAGYADAAVAEHAFALMLAVARGIPRHDRELRAGGWNPASGLQLQGSRLGLVGFGGIARHAARIARGFGMEVAAYNRSPFEHPHVRQVGLDELCATSDVLSLHLALTPETRGIIGRRELELMPPHAMLVNTARGALVDEAALLVALEEGRLLGAGLDVFGREPAEPGDPLIAHPAVVATPHVGYATEQAERELLRRGLETALAAVAAAGTAGAAAPGSGAGTE